MSANFESLVRPFESEVSQPTPYYTPGQLTAPIIVLRYGRGGGGKVLNTSISATTTSYCERHEVEKPIEEE